jgi:HPt (histidine-containing phosphotransfer) domain-containing protein
MLRHPAPTAADLALIDPDGQFRGRLAEDRARLARLAGAGSVAACGPILHRLAGAAATFGYREVSEIAIRLDDALTGAAPPGSAAPDLAPLFAALDRALR